jgi:hypothetical protein
MTIEGEQKPGEALVVGESPAALSTTSPNWSQMQKVDPSRTVSCTDTSCP